MDDERIDEATALLRRTPAVLDAWLRDLPEAWLTADEGKGTWSPLAILGHLIHCERDDWLPRARILLEHGEGRPFDPFDRELGPREHAGRPVGDLLDDFAERRAAGLAELATLDLSDLERAGTHPGFGRVTLGELVCTWAVHDLTHVRQIARAMAKRWAREVGPWSEYMPILGEGPPAPG